MGKKKSDDRGANAKAKTNSKEAPKDANKISFSAVLASMDQKPCKLIKASKTALKVSSYVDALDLPPSVEEDNDYALESDVQKHPVRHQKSEGKPLQISVTDKELKKREKKEMLTAQAAGQAKKVALRDDRDAFTVVSGSRAAVLEG
ncbi:ABC transporter F family member 4-like [Heracleum sosnowskyi]|uniref:ABC transporter F family member 4-like n=1 Tax=Heracleum sosnowskyi TaxID=360622 RepID=A0AAD8HV99_9APIA|nr:ABC transporter F family member 4-like [Heracleum sosnowskyi]